MVHACHWSRETLPEGGQGFRCTARWRKIPSIMVPQDLLDLLVCPACKKPLEYRTAPESLRCSECRRVYPVKDDIPILLIEEATIEPAAS